MNEAMNNLLTRRSCRKYKPDMLPQEVLDGILKAGTYAASGHGTQNPIMIAVTDKEMRDKLSKLNAKIFGKPDIDPFYGAPVVVIVLADKKYPTYVYDGSLAMGNLMLAAHALGVASCWIHRARKTAFITLNNLCNLPKIYKYPARFNACRVFFAFNTAKNG